ELNVTPCISSKRTTIGADLKAVRMHGFGGVEQLVYEDVDEPVLSQPTDASVKLKAAAINHIDIWNRLGATGMSGQRPHTLGADGSGIVVGVGTRGQNVKKGAGGGMGRR